MLSYYVFNHGSTLSDYLSMMEFLALEDVEKGFVAFEHKVGACLVGFTLQEDFTVKINEWLPRPRFRCVTADNSLDKGLDQDLKLTDAMFFTLASCDLIQTKNMADDRRSCAKLLGLGLDDDEAVVMGKRII